MSGVEPSVIHTFTIGRMAIEQGPYMRPASPSRLDVEIRPDADGAIGAIWVAGEARLVSRRTLCLEAAA